ncbi:hypothetical protein BC962_1647 [Gillisia mitskevichiae]|uniref:Nucleotide-binding universal stress UspA family protein n=1 Tax=Gillisia mitskevichiae TaxID=270921 RepID=A0A495PT80_9FLAO|nr:hypothetical protein [Gillisia mitskevichiae]RKS53397.1 hypothetical protein BC962_1647 [Gillisia mitskevichiae]
MKNILIPINFNYNDYAAIDYAIKFFEKAPCHFYFFNNFDLEIHGLNAIELLQADEDWYEKPKKDSENKTRAVLQKYRYNNRAKEHFFSAVIEGTSLIKGLKKTIKEKGIDIVLLAGKNNSTKNNSKYHPDTKRIIENIGECPVIILPPSVKFQQSPEFVFVLNSRKEPSKLEIQNWCELVKITKGTIKIVKLTANNKKYSPKQSNNSLLQLSINMHSDNAVEIDYIDTMKEIKELTNDCSGKIICLVDRKPSIWRKCGFTTSWISNFGPLWNTPLITLQG